MTIKKLFTRCNSETHKIPMQHIICTFIPILFIMTHLILVFINTVPSVTGQLTISSQTSNQVLDVLHTVIDFIRSHVPKTTDRTPSEPTTQSQPSNTMITNSKGRQWPPLVENFQLAIDDLGTTGGTVWAPPMTFHPLSKIYLRSNIQFLGTTNGQTKTTFDLSDASIDIANIDNVVVGDFDIIGSKWGIVIYATDDQIHSNFLVKNIVGTKTWTGQPQGQSGVFQISPYGYSILTNITIRNCMAIDSCNTGLYIGGGTCPGNTECDCNQYYYSQQACEDHGCIYDGGWCHGHGWVKNLLVEQFQAKNCGLNNRDHDYIVGIDITETANVENATFRDCVAEGSWESGFHAEYAPAKKNIHLINCVSKNNGNKPNPTWGAGYLISPGIHLQNCQASENRYGFFIYPYLKTLDSDKIITLENCWDINSLFPLYIDHWGIHEPGEPTAGIVKITNFSSMTPPE